MKAIARRGLAVAWLACAVLSPVAALARSDALPVGLPALPGLGEAMQRDRYSGLALRGYDPVAYHASGRAVAGEQAFEWVRDGVVWRFASAANRDAFREAPDAYLPRFGGFDAVAVAAGRAVEADPRRFVILAARIYFFRDEDGRRLFLREAGLRERSEKAWPLVDRLVAR